MIDYGSSVDVLYVATGRYGRFRPSFYESAEQHLLKKLEKHYFVFTDTSDLLSIRSKNVTTIYTKHREWPYATLLRYEFFAMISDELECYDYLLFFNANIRFVESVSSKELLPDGNKDNGLVGVQHPAYYKLGRWRYPYEKTRKNSAFLRWWSGKYYMLGGAGPPAASLDVRSYRYGQTAPVVRAIW